MKKSSSTVDVSDLPPPRTKLRVPRETVRVLHVRTGIRTGGGPSTGSNRGNGATAQTASLW